MKPRTIEVLKNFASINRSILIREGNVIRTMNPEKTVFAISEIEDNFPRQFGIFDLNQLLSSLSLMDDPELTYESDHILMKKGGAGIKFFYTNERHIKAAPAKNVQLPDTIMKFTLERSVLEKLLKASAVMKLSNMYITDKGVVCRNPDTTGNEYTCPIENFDIPEGSDTEGKIFNINIDSLKILPDTYDVYVTKVALRLVSQANKTEYIIMLNA